MAICVMRNEVFYNTSKRLNIHPDNLELILHGYINKEGYKDETPSDLDIIKAVWGKPFIANEDQLNLYNNQYYNQKHFNDLESATKAYNEALKFYPKTAVSLFRESNGKYIIDVGTPIIPNQEVFYDQDGKVTLRRKFELEKEDLDTVETVIKEEWNNLPREILDKVLNKISLYKESKTTEVRDFLPSMYFGKSNRSTIGEMLNKISRLSTDREIRRIARYLISKGSNDIINNLEIIRTDERDGLRGQYLSNERIVINQAAMTGKSDKEALNNYEQTILHEIAHALTVNAYNTNPELRREALLLFNEFKTIQERYGMPSMYAAKNAKEFIAEFLGRKTFREVLMALNPTKGKKSIGERVYDFIKKCLGISPKSDFYKRADSIISKLLDANNALYGKREDAHYSDINNSDYINTSLNEIQRNIDTRIKEIEKYKSAHNEVMSLINSFKRDPKYSHLSRERFIGALRRRVGQWNTSYNTNIRINDDGSISDNRLNNYENELLEIQFPGYVEKLTNQKVTEIKQKILDDALQHSKELLNPYELSENEIEGLETSLNDEVDPNASKEVANRNNVEHQKKVEAQVNNLLDMEGMSATELRHVADQVAWLISDHITDLQTKEGYAKEQYKDRAGDTEFSTMSRADIVRQIGAQNVMNWCRDTWFDTRNNQFDFDIDDMFLLDLIKDNWDGIMLLAQNMLLTIEDFSIVNNPITGVSEVNTDLTTNPDDFNSPQDAASIEENEGSQQEHWQVENRTLDVISTMTQQVKLALMRCLKIDNNGNPIISRLGIKERMDIREATKFILKNTQGALTLESMVNELTSKSKDNQWLNQIIQRLNDKTGKEADFQSQFFSAFSKHFQPYSIVKLVDGKYESVLVNENPALSDAISQVVSQFQINEHPMFTFEGINKKTFEDFKSQIKELEKFTHSGYNVEKESDKKDASETLGYISSLLGYYVTPDIVAANLNTETFKDMYSSLIWISKAFEKNLTNKTYDPFKFKGNDSIRGNLKNFLKPITAYFDDISAIPILL